MKNRIFAFIALFALTLIFLSNKTDKDDAIQSDIRENTLEDTSLCGITDIVLNTQNEDIIERNTCPYIIKGSTIDMIKGRRPYDLGGREINTRHFVVRVTEPNNPFGPHKHKQKELWFILKGNGTLFLDGVEYKVEENDLIILDPWIEHGLSTKSTVTWICLG